MQQNTNVKRKRCIDLVVCFSSCIWEEILFLFFLWTKIVANRKIVTIDLDHRAHAILQSILSNALIIMLVFYFIPWLIIRQVIVELLAKCWKMSYVPSMFGDHIKSCCSNSEFMECRCNKLAPVIGLFFSLLWKLSWKMKMQTYFVIKEIILMRCSKSIWYQSS